MVAWNRLAASGLVNAGIGKDSLDKL